MFYIAVPLETLVIPTATLIGHIVKKSAVQTPTYSWPTDEWQCDKLQASLANSPRPENMKLANTYNAMPGGEFMSLRR